MLIFFFKVNVNLPQLLWFVDLVAVNGEFRPIFEILKDKLSFSYYAQVNAKR